MFRLSELIKADMRRRKDRNTNKLELSKCHFVPSAFFFLLQGVRQQIAGAVVGDRKAGSGNDGRKLFCKPGKGHSQNALNLSCTIGSLALGEQGGGEKVAFSYEVCALSDSTSCRNPKKELLC